MSRILLDTHAFLWALEGDPRLSSIARVTIEGPDSERMFSVASIWEIAIKHSLGKLDASRPLVPSLLEQLRRHEVSVLAIEATHALGVADLPVHPHHKDPFDRLLVAQCLAENLPIISGDPSFDQYGVRRVW